MSTICQSVLDYKAVKHVVPNQSNHVNSLTVLLQRSQRYTMATFQENHVIEELVRHLAPILADNVIPAVLKRRSSE